MKHRFLIFTLSLLFCGQIFAQQKLSLTLNEAQAYALEHNRTLKNASLDIQKAEATRWQNLASMLPQLSLETDYTNYFGYKLSISGYTIAMNPSGTLMAQVAVALSGAQVIGTQLATMAKEMSKVSLQQSEQEIADQVKTLYYSALVMKQTVELLEKNLKNLKKLYQLTETSVKVGVSEQTDADKIKVQIASMQTSLNSSKRSLEMIYNSMRLQLGVDIDTEIEFIQTIDDLLNVESAMQLLTSDFVLDNNFDYQLVKQNTDILKKQVALSAWNYGPTLSTYYQRNKITYFGKDAGFNTTPTNLVGVSLSIPVFSSGVNYNKLREAKIDYKEQLNTLADTEDALKVQHKQLVYNLKSAFETYETQKENIKVSQRVFDNISRKYEQGMSSSLDVTNSGTDLITAQNNYVQALLELVSAQIELEELLNTNNK